MISDIAPNSARRQCGCQLWRRAISVYGVDFIDRLRPPERDPDDAHPRLGNEVLYWNWVAVCRWYESLSSHRKSCLPYLQLPRHILLYHHCGPGRIFPDVQIRVLPPRRRWK